MMDWVSWVYLGEVALFLVFSIWAGVRIRRNSARVLKDRLRLDEFIYETFHVMKAVEVWHAQASSSPTSLLTLAERDLIDAWDLYRERAYTLAREQEQEQDWVDTEWF